MPIIHKLCQLYQEIYRASGKLPKRDRFGIHAEIEQIILKSLALAVDASLQPLITKTKPIQKLRRTIEVIKYLIRTEQELNIITEKRYWHWQQQIQEISKMATGWEKYTQKEP